MKEWMNILTFRNKFIKKGENQSPDEFLDYLEISDSQVKFQYDGYQIIGETEEIDRIINTCGFINLSTDDIVNTLSGSTANYVVVGEGLGDDCMTDAFKESISKLPIRVESISKLLFCIWMPGDMQTAIKYLCSLTDFIKDLHKNIEIRWGCVFDESLKEQQVKVTLIASGK